MAYPVFIICSRLGAVDQTTNLLSIYDVIEKVEFGHLESSLRVPDNPSTGFWLSMRVTAVWGASNEEIGRDFQFQLEIQPPKGETAILNEGPFRFKSNRHRFIANMNVAPPLEAGELVFCHRIREISEENWVEQKYSITCEKKRVSAVESDKNTNQSSS